MYNFSAMRSAAMTPFKQRPTGQRLFGDQQSDDILMDADNESLVESPPSPTIQRSVLRQSTGNRLFGDVDDGHDDGDSAPFNFMLQSEDRKSGKTPMKKGAAGGVGKRHKILKPVDLNLSFDEEDDEEESPTGYQAGSNMPTAGIASSLVASHQDRQRRKRLQRFAEMGRRGGESYTPTRGAQPSIDPDNAMVASPYISPSSYITMDGRCVTSKNPFSPMVTESCAATSFGRTGAAPSFPVSFDTSSGSDHAGSSTVLPPPRHRLQKRDASSWASPSKRSALYASFTRDGYPERSGRYSFTGSPIKEDEENTHVNEIDISTSSSPSMMAAASKVRRLGLKDDVHYPNSGGGRRHDQNLFVDTTATTNTRPHSGTSASSSYEEISPTDVLSFPAPPTPTKNRRPSNIPYPSVSNPPETPFISRSGRRPRRRMPDHHDGSDLFDDGISTCTSYQSEDDIVKATPMIASRFKSDFDIIGELGKGSFGAVYKVLSRLDGCMYAVKSALRKVKGNADRDRMLKEVYALAALSDKADPATFHIVRYHQAWMEDDRLYIQTELCSSNLADEIQRSGGRLSDERRYKLLREMLLALEFLHREGNGMCHLDVKPENIFIKEDPPHLNVFKLGDFGLVTSLIYHKDVEEGDSRYMSMELLSGDHRDLTKSDIFSLGATLYEISLGRPLPMNGPEWQAIRAGSLENLQDTPYEMDMIIREMMNPTFCNRPSAADLLRRPQLLSNEQKLLVSERNKVFQAKLALAQQARTFQKFPPPPAPGALTRRNTWSGGYF